MDHKALGQYGEQVAQKYLENRGYKFFAKNFHAQGGEIDLIMKHPVKNWVFVEVKTRRSQKFGSPKDAITPNKINKMLVAIYKFFETENVSENTDFCIEAICLRMDGKKVFCEHIQNIGLD